MRALKGFACGVAALLAWGSAGAPARAVEIVLADVASDRVERQRAFARDELPLRGTPALDTLEARLRERSLTLGRPIYIRIFKASSELELWLQNDKGTFTLLATYPVCHWTGSIGPKLKEGDKQSPEGFYSVGVPQTRLVGRWRKAFNLGFPNRHDQLLGRTGSYILIHGGCSSVGCFAMTNPVQDEIYNIAQAALKGGQQRFQVHIFPFRMTPENLARHSAHAWAHTWADLMPAYDSFERTHIPPKIVVCGVRYQVADGLPGETGNSDRNMPILRPPAIEVGNSDSSVVTDDYGAWLPPHCVIEDEEQRRAASAGPRGTAPSEERSGLGVTAIPPALNETALSVESVVKPTTANGRVAAPHRPARRSRAPREGAESGRGGDGGEESQDRLEQVRAVSGGS